jgi:hypothetical protein
MASSTLIILFSEMLLKNFKIYYFQKPNYLKESDIEYKTYIGIFQFSKWNLQIKMIIQH